MTKREEKRFTILIADDNAIMRKLLRETLRKSDYEIIEALNGSEAIDQFKTHLPDMILMDVDMPVLDGFEACRIIRTLPGGQYVPIMVVTGMDDIESINKAYEVGATDFLIKPINYGVISYRVRNLLRTSQNFIDLQRNRIKLKNAQQVAKLGIWDWDRLTNETSWSEELYNITNLPAGEIIEKQNKILEIVHPDDKPIIESCLKECFKSNKPYMVEYRIVLDDGSVKYLSEATDILFDEFDHQVGIIGSVLDITSLKTAELINKALADSFSRFVPNEFLKTIGANAQNIRAGDWIEKEMTILVLDIRNFSLMAEKMTPEKIFSFINIFFKNIEQAINDNGGFIDKYIGDSVMALFNSADDAMRASLDAMKFVKGFNENEGKNIFNLTDIRIGVALNTGSLIMGVIGTHYRSECTVISNSVNLTFRLEDLNKTFGSAIITSKFFAENCQDFDAYPHRFLGKIKVHGKEEIVDVYEVLANAEEIKKKLATKENFEKALSFYQNNDLEFASTYLHKVLAVDPNDQAALFLSHTIAAFKTFGMPKQWNGVIAIEQK